MQSWACCANECRWNETSGCLAAQAHRGVGTEGLFMEIGVRGVSIKGFFMEIGRLSTNLDHLAGWATLAQLLFLSSLFLPLFKENNSKGGLNNGQ